MQSCTIDASLPGPPAIVRVVVPGRAARLRPDRRGPIHSPPSIEAARRTRQQVPHDTCFAIAGSALALDWRGFS
jgi:hypothetical protein